MLIKNGVSRLTFARKLMPRTLFAILRMSAETATRKITRQMTKGLITLNAVIEARSSVLVRTRFNIWLARIGLGLSRIVFLMIRLAKSIARGNCHLINRQETTKYIHQNKKLSCMLKKLFMAKEQ